VFDHVVYVIPSSLLVEEVGVEPLFALGVGRQFRLKPYDNYETTRIVLPSGTVAGQRAPS
jgi:hypothetical protein